jgi:hypothetical protein
MGKQKTSPLAQVLDNTTLKIEAPKTVALSWNEIASPEFAKSAEAANQSITTAGEKQFLADIIAKQKQEERLQQERINKEAQELVKTEVDSLKSKKEEVDKKIEILEKNNLAGPGPKPFYSGESITELTTQRNNIVQALAKKSAIFKNNPETQKKIAYSDKVEKTIYKPATKYESLIGDMDLFSWEEDGIAVASNPSIWVMNYLKDLPAMTANFWSNVKQTGEDYFTDEKEEVERRSKLPKTHAEYIDKKKYEEGKELRAYANEGLITLALQEKENEKERVQAVASKSNNPFNLDKIKTTFTLNRIQRDIEDLEAARDKKSGAYNYGKEIFGKTLINPGANITFLENVRTAQFDYWVAQEVEEDLNEKLKAKAKTKGIKDLSQLSEDDFKEVYDSLSPLDKILVESKYTSLISNSIASEEQSYSYKTVKNTGTSADFIVSLLISRGAGKLIGRTAGATGKALGRTASTSETGLLSRTLTNRGLSAKAAEKMVSRVNTAAGVIGQGTAITYINPRELTGPRYSKYKSINDEDGNVQAVFGREGAYALVKKEVEEDKKAYSKVYDYLKANEDSLQEDDRNLLRFLSGSLGYTKDEKYVNDKGEFVPVESLDEKLKSYEVNSKLYVHGRGIVSNIIETGTEIYTGKVLGKLANKVGAKAGALAEKVPFANKLLVSTSGKLDNFQKWYATSKLGRAQRDYEFFTGKYFGNFQKATHIGGVGEEIIEEYAAAASNSLVDWDATEIKEAFTMDFLGEVTAQTLLLTGSMKATGASATLTKRLYGNLYDRKLKKIDEEIASLNKFLESNPEDSDTLLSIKTLQEEKDIAVKNSSLTGLGISKRINKDHNAFSNTRRYLDQKAAMRRAIDDLKGATTDEDLNRILDLLDTTNSSDEARVREAFTLRNTGKVHEAEKLEAAIDKSTFLSALSTKSERDLQGALNSLLKDTSRTMSVEQRKRLTDLNDTLEEVVKFQEENKDTKGNLQLATMFKAEQLSAKKAKETIINQRNSLREGAVQEFEAIFDTYFSNSGIDKAEATQAFIAGTLIDNPKFDPIIEKANTLNSKGFIGYTSSFLTEERLLNGLNSLDLAIQETLNPEPHLIERNNFNEQFIGLFNDLYQGKLDDLSSLGITDVEFDENNKVIFTPKLSAEILDKLSEKFIAENKLTPQQMAEVKLKNKTLVEAFLAREKETAKKLEQVQRMMEENLKVEEDETTSEDTEVVVVDVDSFVETQEVLEEVTSELAPEPVTGTVTAPQVNIQTQQDEVARLRAEEQVENAEIERRKQEALKNNPPLSEKGHISLDKISAKYDAEEKELYDKYDKLITPLLTEIKNTQAGVITGSQDSLMDDTDVQQGKNQNMVPDLSIDLDGDSEKAQQERAKNVELYEKLLNHFLPKIRQSLNFDTTDVIYVLEEILNISTPEQKQKLSYTIGSFIKAWKNLNLPITESQAQQVNRMARAKFQSDVLSQFHSIFEQIVSVDEVTPVQEYDTKSEEIDNEVKQIEVVATPVVELAPAQIEEAPLNLEDLEEKQKKELQQEILSGEHPLSAKVAELTELGVDFWEAYAVALTGVTEDTKVTKEETEFYFTPFLGFNALPYEWYSYEDKNGVERLAKRTIVGAQLNVSQDDRYIRPDFRDLLHPDKYVTGSTFSIEVAKEEDWENIIYREITSDTEVTLEDGRIIPAGTKTIISFADFMRSKPANFRNTEEFQGLIPIFMTDNTGKRLAYIHTLDWYTPDTIPNPNPLDESTTTNPSQEWLDHIEKYKEGTRRLRTAISKGLTKVSIEKPAEGKAGMLAASETRISVQQSNPQAVLVVQKGATMKDFLNGVIQSDSEFATGSKVLLNNPKEFTPQKNKKGEVVNPDGHTWAIYRVGSKLHPTKPGEVIKTYRAIRLGSQVEESHIETVRWAIAAFKTLNGESIPKHMEGYSFADIKDAQKIAAGVNAATGLDISKLEGLGSFMRMFIKIDQSFIKEYEESVNKNKKEGEKRASYGIQSVAPYINYLFNKDISPIELLYGLNDRADNKPIVSQHTNANVLRTKSTGRTKLFVPQITISGVTPFLNAQGESMSYHDYLKDTLYTNYKAFDMDTTGQAPMYSLTVQPKILINYNNEDIDSSKSVVSATEITLQEKIEEAAKESLKQLEEVPQQLTEEEAEKQFEAIIERLKTFKVDYTIFLEGDESVGSLEELKRLFDLTANLSVNQQKTILGQISAEINSLLGFRAKVNSKSINKIKNEVKSTINKKLRERLSELIMFRSTITNSGINNPKTAALLKAIENSIENITSMQQEYDTLFARALKDSLAETKVTQVEEQENQEENELEKEKNFSKESIEEKLKDKASSQIRMIMHSIPMFNTQGEIVTGYLDLPSYMSLNDTYNLVLRTVSADIDTRADFKEIMDKLAKSEHPAIKIIVERLTGADQQVKNQFVYNITAHALSSKFVMYDEHKGKVSLKLYDTNSSEINRQIKQRWIENSKFTNLYHEDGSFNTVYAQSLINEFEKFGVNPIEADEAALRGWLEKVGIIMHNKTWEKLYTQGYRKGNQTTSFFTLLTHKKFGLYPNLIAFLKAGIADTEENYRANSVNDILSNIGGISNNIALIEADYNPELISLSYQDNGKSIFTLTPPKYITERITSLIRREGDKASQLVEDLLEISYNKNSMILGLLSEDSEMADLLRVHHISLGAIKNKNQKDSQGKITELSALDYDMFALGGLQDRKVQNFTSPKQYEGIPLRIANMLSSTMSDKDTALFFTVPVLDLLADANYSFYTDEEGHLKMTDKLLDVLVNLVVRPEIERIINFNAKVEKTGVKNYNIAAKFFHNIPALNSLQVKGMNLAEYLNSEESAGQDVDAILNLINVDVKDRLQRVVTSEANVKIEAWKELGLVKKGKSTTLENKIFNDNYFTEKGIGKDPVKDFDLGVMDFVINSLIFQAESTKVFSGDIAQFSQDKLWYKAMEKASARDKVTHTLYTMTTEDYIKVNKEIGTNLGKRLAYEIAPGKQGAVTEENRYYNQIFLQDSKDIAENTLDLIEMYEGLPARKKSEKQVRKYKLLQTKLANLQDKTSLSEKETKEMEVVTTEIEKIRDGLIKNYPNLKDYFEIESTDAQEYTTVTEHLQILDSLGRITKEQYNRIISALASESSLEEEDLKIVMQPIKPMHGGAYVMKEADMERIVYVKSSSFPLIPELTKGTSLDKLRVAMERLEAETGRFTRASYQSANKVGAVVNPINSLDAMSLESIFNYKDSANTDPSSPMLVLDRNNFRIQQDVPFKSGKAKPDTNAMGTQIFKMLFSNDIISGETFYFKGQKKTGKELYKIYENTFSKIIDYETSKLYKDLGLNERGEVTNEKVFMSKLRDVLEDEAVNRGYSIREIRNLQLVELVDINTKETYYDFKNPLWLSSNSNKYEALLNSIITNRIMQFKMPGNSFIAGSENGFRFSESVSSLSPKQQNKIIYLEGWNGEELQGTHFTEEDGAPVFTSAQVMVSSKIKGANNKLIDLFEGYDAKTGDVSKALYVKRNDNGTLGLKEDMLDPEMLKMFSFRTPTSSHISGSSIEIVGILPPSCGDLMLVPKNFTKQKGLDFDIDKEGAYSFNHYIDQEGKVKIIDERYLREVLKGNIRVSLINTSDFDATQYYQNRRTWFSDRRKDLKAIKVMKNAIKNKKIIETEIEDLNYILSVKQKGKNQDEETIAELGLLIDQANLDLETINEVIEDIEKTSSLKANFDRKQFQAEKEKMIDEYEILYADLERLYFQEVENQHVKSIEKKIAQNDFTRVYLAVYDSPSKEVQKKLNSILSMEVASGQAETIASWKEEGIRNAFIEKQVALGKNRKEAADMYKEAAENFTMLSYNYQKAKMDLGAIGKKAIGVYATAATFAALIQTQNPKGLPMKAFTIGNITSSKIGAINSLSKNYQRSLSDILGERINTATDNEKEQILGRVGVDDMTIGTDSFLALAGFDLGETGNSISYMLLSQPAVVEFNKKIKESKGIIGEWIDEKKLISEMVSTLSNKKMSYVQNPDTKRWHFFEENALGVRGELKNGSALLTESVLEEGIQAGKVEGINQAHALMTYIQAKGLADRLTPMVSALNTNSLGKSIPEAMLKHSKMAKAMFGERPLMEGFLNLIGEEVFTPEEGYPFEVINQEGLPEIHYVNPTTPQGKIAVTGLHLGKVLFENLFAYNDVDLKEAINIVLSLQEIDEDRVTAEDTEFIVQEFKKYLLSNPKLSGNFEDSSLKRYELMTDNNHNTSLAKYIHSLFKNKEVKFAKGIEAIKNNPLVGKRLLYKIGKGEEEVSTITFNNSSTDSLSDEELYLSLPSLMLDNLPLPDRNGKPYTTQDLVEDLVAYSFLEGGVQKATQFIKFVPIELQAEIGKVNPKTGAFVSINDQLQNYNPRRIPISQKKEVFGVNEMSGFISQFFQNNPTLAPRISYKDAKLNINETNRTLTMTPERAAVSTPKIVHFIDRNREVHLFQHIGQGQYTALEHNTLAKNTSQYSKGKSFQSIKGPEVRAAVMEDILGKVSHDFKIQESMPLEDALNQIATISLPANRQYLNQLAALFKVNIDKDKTFSAQNIGSRGKAINGDVIMDLNYLLNQNTSNEKVAETIIHEVVHSLTVKELDRYFYINNTTGSYELIPEYATGEFPLPTHVTQLNATYKAFLNSSLIDLKRLEKLKEHIKKIKDKNITAEEIATYTEELKTMFTPEEFKIYYAGTNIKEFMSTLFESAEFRQQLDTVEYKKSGQSLLEKIVDALVKILNSVFPGLKDNYLAKEALIASFKFMEQERKFSFQTDNFVPLTDKNLDAEYDSSFGVDIDDKDPDMSLEVSQEEWESLTEEEKQRIKDCI